ncbi:MAG: hypothetical protein GEV07_30450 [Streptosporangiales bacterium]|nr:hypothetical protein [Streptosporangiales bacterium]
MITTGLLAGIAYGDRRDHARRVWALAPDYLHVLGRVLDTDGWQVHHGELLCRHCTPDTHQEGQQS